MTPWSAAAGSVSGFLRRGFRRTDGAAAAAGAAGGGDAGGAADAAERGRPKADATGTATMSDSYGANVRFAFREENFS